MPHQGMNVTCKKCGHYYCAVCDDKCTKCGEVDVADAKTMKTREKMREHTKRHHEDEATRKEKKPRGVVVGGITGALWVGEMESFLNVMKKERGTFICRAGRYPRLFPIFEVSGKEIRPYTNEEIDRLLASQQLKFAEGYFEDKGLLPIERIEN